MTPISGIFLIDVDTPPLGILLLLLLLRRRSRYLPYALFQRPSQGDVLDHRSRRYHRVSPLAKSGLIGRAILRISRPAPFYSFVFLYGLILDNKRWNMKRRAQIGFVVVTVPTLVSFCWLVANQKKFNDKSPGKMDWTASGWANAYVPFYMMQILGYMCQTVSPVKTGTLG
jgi:hypothetical protein